MCKNVISYLFMPSHAHNIISASDIGAIPSENEFHPRELILSDHAQYLCATTIICASYIPRFDQRLVRPRTLGDICFYR